MEAETADCKETIGIRYRVAVVFVVVVLVVSLNKEWNILAKNHYIRISVPDGRGQRASRHKSRRKPVTCKSAHSADADGSGRHLEECWLQRKTTTTNINQIKENSRAFNQRGEWASVTSSLESKSRLLWRLILNISLRVSKPYPREQSRLVCRRQSPTQRWWAVEYWVWCCHGERGWYTRWVGVSRDPETVGELKKIDFQNKASVRYYLNKTKRDRKRKTEKRVVWSGKRKKNEANHITR